MSPTVVSQVVAGVRVVVVGSRPPSDADWDAHLAAVEEEAPVARGVLVVTHGGSPSAAQRKRLVQTRGGIGMPTAVVSESVVARAVATMLRWFGGNHQAFAPYDIDKAYAFLSLSAADRALVHQFLTTRGADLRDAPSLRAS
jgi:hypothetical protein